MKKYLVFALALFTLQACSDQKQLSETQFSLSLQEIASIGEFHNESVIAGLHNLNSKNQSNLNWDGINSQQDLFDAYMDTYPHKDVDSYIDVANFLLYSLEEFNINDHAQHFSNSNVITVYNDIIESSLMSNIDNFGTYQNYIETTNIHIQANFSGFDKDFLLTTTSVAVNSAYLWLSEDKGGLGQYDALIDMYPSTSNEVASTRGDDDCRDAIIAADLTAAAGYFMGVGVGIIVPGANIAIATTIGWGSGFASVMAGLRCKRGDDDEEEGPLPIDDTNGTWP